MRVLTIGGTGKVGKPLLSLLSAQGVDLRVITRSPNRASELPTGAEAFVVDIVDDPDTALEAFKGVDAVFMLNAASAQETVEGLLVVALARRAGIGRFVYQSVHCLEAMAQLPHIAPKLVIERAIQTSGMDYTLLRPNHFYQNDDDCRFALMNSDVYIQPIGPVGCWRVDVRDIAEAAAIVLTTDGHSGETYAIVGPENLTGEDCAEAWGKALGRQIRYIGDIDVWKEGARPFIPAWLNFDLGLMHYAFAERGMQATMVDLERLSKLLGRGPRSFQSYADEKAEEWKS